MATWVFDLDGCLIDSLTGTSLRPGAVEALTRLRAEGHRIVIWSAGGATYARGRATDHGLAGLVDRYESTAGRDAAGHYDLPERGATFVDDRPEDLPPDATVIAVSPYLSPDPYDRVFTQRLGGPAAPPESRVVASHPFGDLWSAPSGERGLTTSR